MNTYTIITSAGCVIVVRLDNMNELRSYLRQEEILPSVIKVN